MSTLTLSVNSDALPFAHRKLHNRKWFKRIGNKTYLVINKLMLWLEPKVYIKVKDDGYKLMVENPLDKTKNINGSSGVLNSTYYKQGPMHHLSIHEHVEE